MSVSQFGMRRMLPKKHEEKKKITMTMYKKNKTIRKVKMERAQSERNLCEYETKKDKLILLRSVKCLTLQDYAKIGLIGQGPFVFCFLTPYTLQE